MNKARLLTISKTNGREIAQALKSVEWLYAKTERFESTLAMKEKIAGCLRALAVSYSASLGQLKKGQRLIYAAKHLHEIRVEAVHLAAYAMTGHAQKDVVIREHKEKIVSVFDLAIVRAEWLEEK